jgi:transcriptional regulator with XRE-family HTH domain
MPRVKVRKPQDIGSTIKAARQDSGLSQEELANRLGFNRDYLVDLEAGATNLFARRLLAAFHELGVTITLTYGDDHGQS